MILSPPKYYKKDPRYSEGVMVHPYCTRTCANLAKGEGPTNGNTPVPAGPGRTANPFIATNPSITITPGNPSNTTTLGNIANPLGTPPPPTPEADSYPQGGLPVPANSHNSVISTNSTITLKSGSFVYWRSSSVPTCKTPGCSSVDQHGVASDWPPYQYISAVRFSIPRCLKS